MSPRRRAPAELQLDFRSGLPVYLQLVGQIRRLASTGRLRPGDQLPTVRALARRLGINFNTVARAYRILHEAGVVSSQRGRGTYIQGRGLEGSGRKLGLRTLAARYIAQARRQDFSQGEIVGMVFSLLGMRTTPPAHGGE